MKAFTCSLFVALVLRPVGAAPAPVLPLFAPTPVLHAPIKGKHHNALRSWTASVDRKALRALRPGERARFNLFDDATFLGQVERKDQPVSEAISLTGRLPEDGGSFTLVEYKGVLVGVVRSMQQQRTFRLDSQRDGTVMVTEIMPSSTRRCGVGLQAPGGDPAAAQDHPPAARADGGVDGAPAADAVAGLQPEDGAVLDIMVLYTGAAREEAGDREDIEAEAVLALVTANEAFSWSRIRPRLRLVHLQEVAYDENGTYHDHLNRLTKTDDGFLDTIHGLRDLVGADLVSLLVDDDDDDTLCGLGSQLDQEHRASFKAFPFSVVNWECSADDYALAHEVGHNLGCGHDRENAGNPGLFGYSYGWRACGGFPTSCVRTIMAYKPGTRLGVFSNPEVPFPNALWLSFPSGDPDVANNARTINEVAYEASNWWRGYVWVDFVYRGEQENGNFVSPYNTLAEGVGAARAGTIVRIKTGSTVEPITIAKATILEAHGGPVTISGR